MDADSDLLTTSRAIDESELRPETRAFKGQRVRLNNGCSAKVGGFLLLSRVIPHFSERPRWNNQYQDPPVVPLTDRQQTQAAFDLGSKLVVARLTGCEGGKYAQRETTPAPVQASSFEDDDLARRAVSAFARRPEVLEDQRAWKEDVEGERGNWWEPSVEVHLYRHPASRQTLVSVTASIPADSCSDTAPREWALFELRGKALVLLKITPSDPQVMEVLDVNGDGRLEVITQRDSWGDDYTLQSPDEHGPFVDSRPTC